MSINSIAPFLHQVFKICKSYFCIQLALKNKLPGELRDLLTNTVLVDREVLKYSVSQRFVGRLFFLSYIEKVIHLSLGYSSLASN